jgi:hypothetical protein
MGAIGLGSRGSGDMGAFLGRGDVQVVAVCDVRKNVRDGKKQEVDQRYKSQDCKAYGDFRELLERSDIDAVLVATPDHWHAIIVIEACRRGKDVYCEKPETLTLAEGPRMLAAARRYGSVVSGGSQRVLEGYRGLVSGAGGGDGPHKSINVKSVRSRSSATFRPSPFPKTWIGTCGSGRPHGRPTTASVRAAATAPTATAGGPTRTTPAAA